MTAKECITGRRSIRKFKADPISHELLGSIIETASYAPSWKNTQVTRYIAVEDPALKAAIADQATTAWPGNGTIIKDAPALIVVTVLKGRSGYERDGSFSTTKETHWTSFDAGIATQTFCLAAYEQGIGSVIMGIFDENIMGELLAIPEDREVAAIVAIGYPNEAPTAPRRKTVEELISYL